MGVMTQGTRFRRIHLNRKVRLFGIELRQGMKRVTVTPKAVPHR